MFDVLKGKRITYFAVIFTLLLSFIMPLGSIGVKASSIEDVGIDPTEVTLNLTGSAGRWVGLKLPVQYVELPEFSWSSEDDSVAVVDPRPDNYSATIYPRGVGKTVIHCKGGPLDLTVNVTVVDAGNGINTISSDQVKQLYNKYVAKYPKTGASPLKISTEGILNEHNNITDYGRQATLDMINFYREMSGIGPVSLDSQLNGYAQAAVDYLTINGLDIDHNAADNSGNEAAKTGLHGSNLYGGNQPVDSIQCYFNDIRNLSPNNVGHREWLIYPYTSSMGVASAGSCSALYVQNYQRDSDKLIPVISYPAAGESPIELISVDDSGVPIWSINFGSYYAPANNDIKNIKLNVTDNTGKSVDFSYTSNPDKTSPWFSEGFIDEASSIVFNPYSLVDGNYQNAVGKTYTITVKGLQEPFDTLTYTSHIGKLSNIVRGIPDDAAEVYRLYNSQNGEHLYTTDANEASTLARTNVWTDEGTGWFAPSSGTPVYRLNNDGLQNHLYTTDENEVNVLTTQHGWTKDNGGNPVFYSGGDVPIYRVYNQELRGLHHLTTDENEYNVLPSHGWTQEGVGIYAIAK